MAIFTYEDYCDGIQDAADRGEITCEGDVLRTEDPFTHFSHCNGRMDHTNMRPIHPAILAILGLFQERLTTFVELGPGAGLASSQVKVQNPDVRVRCFSQTPINPHVQLNMDDFHMRRRLLKFLSDEQAIWVPDLDSFSPELRRLLQGYLERNESIWGVVSVLPYILELSERYGLGVFTVLKTPFVDHQTIGLLFEDTHLEPESATVIYETIGPMYYTKRDLGVAFDEAYEALEPGGVMSLTGNAFGGRLMDMGVRGLIELKVTHLIDDVGTWLVVKESGEITRRRVEEAVREHLRFGIN